MPLNQSLSSRFQELKKVRTFAGHWYNFWFLKIDPFILGFFRMALGFFYVCYFIMLAPNWLTYFGPHGFSWRKPIELHEYELFESLLLLIHTDIGMWLYYFLSIMMALSLMMGVMGRVPIVFLWFNNISIIKRNGMIFAGEEEIMAIILFYSMFLPLNATCRWYQWTDKFEISKIFRNNNKVTVWALRPLQIQLVLIYLLSVPHKILTDSSWLDGTAVYYTLNTLIWPRWPGSGFLAWGNAIFSKIVTYYTLMVETLFPILVWFKKSRLICVFLSLILHIGLMVNLQGLMMFSAAFIVGLVLFLPSRRTKEFFCLKFLNKDYPVSKIS